MEFSISVLPPSPALADDVMGYLVRRRGPATGSGLPFEARFPANMYSAMTIVHRGRLVDAATGRAAPPVTFSGVMTQSAARSYHDAPETTVVLFKPGRMTDLLRLPATEFADRWLHGEDLLSHAEQELIADRMAAQPTVARQVHVLEELVAQRLRRVRAGQSLALARMVQALVWRLPHMSVIELADHVGIGVRQLHRQFLGTFGVSPKALIRLARLQLTLWHVQAAARRTRASLAAVAQAAGFADHAHMAKDLRALVGRSPAGLRDRMQRSLPSEWAFELRQDLLNPFDGWHEQAGPTRTA